jgi:ferrous iron transport protein B
VISPLGFDWQMGVGLLTGIGAKELVVSTLNVLYANGEEVTSSSLPERMGISPLAALSYMIFILFYFPCVATVVAIGQESKSWKWALFAILYTTLLAWLASFCVYQIGSLL